MKSLSHLQAILCAITGFCFWVLADTAMKLSSETALPSYQIVGFIGFFGAFFMVLKAASRGEIKNLWPKNPKTQFIRVLICFTNMICCVFALKYLPLTLFYVIVFMSPMAISLTAAVFLKERLSLAKTIALIVGFMGVVIAINPFSSNIAGHWIGYLAGLGAVACFTANMVWLRIMTQSESADSLAFFTGFVQSIICAGLMLIHAEPMTLNVFIILLMAGIFNVIGNICNFIAMKNTTAATVAQFHYTQIITGALLGWLIWHDVPTLHLTVGAVIIIGSGLYIAAHARKMENLATVTR
jgi:drug/metabolite transporter (DMT)-like permease